MTQDTSEMMDDLIAIQAAFEKFHATHEYSPAYPDDEAFQILHDLDSAIIKIRSFDWEEYSQGLIDSAIEANADQRADR